MIDDIKKITVKYVSVSELSIDEARNLYVEIAEEYLNRFNQNILIRPFLHDYPFEINNVELMLSFETEDGKYPKNNDIALMFIIRSELLYEGYDEEKQEYVRLHKEPYSEAIKLARLNNQNN